MRILVANDDGIDAPGIKLLASKLMKYGEVVVVAPDRPRSASSHSILFSPIEFTRVESCEYANDAYKISGTPADCVRVGTSILGDFDIVFSGINNGLNLGTDIIYSGTVAVAREAYIEGIPAVAISVDVNQFDTAIEDIDNLLEFIFTNELYSRDYVLNINYPVKDKPVIGYKAAKMGIKNFKTHFKLENGICTTAAEKIEYDTDPESDVYNAEEGYVTFVPVVLDMTCTKSYEKIKSQCN